ncbi:MAG: 3'(2'),5'-bisphosphate nucleotidase [Chitinophagaceae bacterium]|nr:MAG: 3'(2'),5'-bisphosphate nucleotidase [Chitinophagaceae bacterium]
MTSLNKLKIDDLLKISAEAGKLIMAIYKQPFDVEEKEDKTPLTLADKASNGFITEALKKLTPDIPIISEEMKQVDYEVRKDWKYLWMVDPLDGTKEFIKKNGEFTVNISLISENESILGVVHIPATNESYFAKKNEGAFKVTNTEKVKINKSGDYRLKENIKVVASRSHKDNKLNSFLEDLQHEGKNIEIMSKGSSLKFCMIAEGSADVYPRFGPTMEWDTAAAQIIAEEAGCKVLDISNGERLSYNKEDLLNPGFIVY